jgi:uncharacterized protein (DUF433 family)
MAKAGYRVVAGEDSELHDEPHIEGRRITVRFIRNRVEDAGVDPQAIADRHELDIADVYQALAYYHDHPEEMAAVEQAREAAMEAHAAEALTGPDDL